MKKIINGLSERKGANIALMVGYFILILFMHDPLVNLSVWIMNGLSLPVYDIVVLVTVGLVLGGLGFVFVRNLIKEKNRVKVQLGMVAFILLALAAHLKVLLVMNIELIHFFQFGLFTLILFPLTRKFGVTVLLLVIFACLDELFQYQWLYPERENYFDLNDVITDLLGCGAALVFLINAGVESNPVRPMKSWLKSPWFWVALSVGSKLLLAGMTGLIVTYASEAQPHTLLLLNEATEPQPFWVEFYESGIYFHILRPREGIPIILGLMGLFFLLDYPRKSE